MSKHVVFLLLYHITRGNTCFGCITIISNGVTLNRAIVGCVVLITEGDFLGIVRAWLYLEIGLCIL